MAVLSACRPLLTHCARAVVCTQRAFISSSRTSSLNSPLRTVSTSFKLQVQMRNFKHSTFNVQPRFARHTLVPRRADIGVENVCVMMGRALRCANNTDRSSCRYSSCRVLSTCLHHRTPTAHRKHAIVIITMSTGSLHLFIRPSVAISSDSTTGLSLLELRTSIFKPLQSRSQLKSSASSSTSFAAAYYDGRVFAQEGIRFHSMSTKVCINPSIG